MLSPDYLLRVSEGGEAIAETLHDEIIKQIVERISLRLDRGDNYILTPRDKWQIQVLQEAGFLLEDIQKILVKHTGLMRTEIAEAMEAAGVTALDYDNKIYRAAGLDPAGLTQSPHLVRLLQRGYEATMGEWENFTRTTANACHEAFVRECDKAYNMVASGASGYGQAYLDAINSIVSDGVYVTYPSGHTDTIETATLRCIRTGVSQATGQITDARMDEMDWDIVLVSSHLGARVTDKEDFTNHYWWQGKFYSRSGKDERFPPFSVCGLGNVQGIHGANCRHQHMPGDGEFNPFDQYDSEENRKEYELQQRQRVMERRIRDSKRKCMGLKHGLDSATTDEAKALIQKEYDKQAALLEKRNAAYTDFCKENDLKKKHERIAIAKWDRQQAKNARIAANRAKKNTGNAENQPVKIRKDYYAEPIANVAEQQTIGQVIIENGYNVNSHANEIRAANILAETVGGEIRLIQESNKEGEKTPDILWDGKMWEVKNTSTEKAVDTALRTAIKQIKENPGGVILNFDENDIDFSLVEQYVNKRMSRRADIDVPVIIIHKGKVKKIMRRKK